LSVVDPRENGAALQAAFREVMAAVCTPVSVVTAISREVPHGTTVSAFASLSMQPPMVLLSLDRQSNLLTMISETRRFGLNVLGSDQSQLARAFARKGTGKFAGVAWWLDTGVPRIAGPVGFLACQVAHLVEGGDHIVVLGGVLTADAGDGRPLTYHGRGFGTHVPLLETVA
jgi:flavin reductase (DIM6/NTAB) family NADH-FMN oxidoreductase RutF